MKQLLDQYFLPEDTKRITSLERKISEYEKYVGFLGNTSFGKNKINAAKKNMQKLKGQKNIFEQHKEVSTNIFLSGLIILYEKKYLAINPFYTFEWDHTDYYPENSHRIGRTEYDLVGQMSEYFSLRIGSEIIDTTLPANADVDCHFAIDDGMSHKIWGGKVEFIRKKIKSIATTTDVFEKYWVLVNVKGIERTYAGPILEKPALLGQYQKRLFHIEYGK